MFPNEILTENVVLTLLHAHNKNKSNLFFTIHNTDTRILDLMIYESLNFIRLATETRYVETIK